MARYSERERGGNLVFLVCVDIGGEGGGGETASAARRSLSSAKPLKAERL